MKRSKFTIKQRIAAFSAAGVMAVAGISLFAPTNQASAAGGGFTIINNCGAERTFGYNYHDVAPGTGTYHKVAAGTNYTVNSGQGIFRVELPRGVMNTFIYNGNYNQLLMC